MENYRKYYKYILLVVILLFIIVLGVYYSNMNKKEVVDASKSSKKIVKKVKKKEETKSILSVDLKGAVNNPNVYQVKEGARVIDVINMAGGLKENADTSIINLSMQLKDEMCIIIYTTEQLQKYKDQMLTTKQINEQIKKDTVKVDEFNDAEIKESKETKKNEDVTTKTGKVSINNATKEELMTISGIGESKANSIIEYREENGLFEKIEDIMNVSGIGESLYEKIKEFIEI